MPWAPWSSAKPPVLSAADPAGNREPSLPRTRTSWTPSSQREATAAYTPPEPSLPRTVTAVAPVSSSKPRVPSAADPAGDRAPSPWTRASWTPLSRSDAIRACGAPPISKAATPRGPLSSKARLSASEPAGERVPLPWMRTSWTPLSSNPETRACFSPSPRSNTAASNALSSSRSSPSSLPSDHDSLASMVPFPCTRTSWMPSSLNPAARACSVSFISNTRALVAPPSSRPVSALPSVSPSVCTGERVSLLSCMRSSWTALPPCAAAIACAAPPR